jgi:hypothetical protein
MAHLWFRNDEDFWSTMPLHGVVDISVNPPRAWTDGFRPGEETGAAVIRAGAVDSPLWVLVAAPESGVRINGFAPVAGVRVLQDRDEIRATACITLFFSTETLAHVEEFPGSERPVYCGRCRQAMVQGQLAVRCPQCAIVYHQIDTLPCWTYAPSCAFCPQSTSLDAEFAWFPET